jgi:hypothetical protein
MIRLNHCSQVGGSGTETRRRAPGQALAAALAAAFAVLAIGGVTSMVPISSAFAQTPGTAGPVSLGDLFTGPDSVDLKDGAADKLREAAAQAINPRGCPQQVKFKVIVKSGDPIFQAALAGARRDVIRTIVEQQLPSIRTEFSGEVGSKDDVQVDYDRMQDKEPPKLHTSSVPPKGSKVNPGDQITVTMVARDDATTWQTGIQRIQLVAQSQGDALVGAQDYPPVIRPTCEGRPEPRTLVLTYRVPRDPPPIVRLRAIAEDFANHHDTDIGEFPIGDWYGTIKKTAKGGGHNHTIDIDYAFEIESSGTLKGRAFARITTEEGQVPGCTMLWTYSPSEFDIPFSGRRDGEKFEIALDPGTTTATFAGCGQSNTFPAHLNPAVHPTTKYTISAQDGAKDAVEQTAGALPWGVVMRDTIEIHRARQ